ncbi:serine/threonine/tyrosine-interacting protein-like isoform X4 [Antedon mediterranea]
METYGLAYRKAFKIVQQKRFCINPNEGFQQQLVEYEPICKARAQQAITDIANQQPHDTGVKRRHDDDDNDANTAHSSKSGPNKMMTTEPS